MRQRTRLLAVGGTAFLGVAIATLPAALVANHLPAGLALEGAGGSVWSGGADRVRQRGTALGSASWKLEPLALLAGRLAYRIELTRADASLRGRIAATIGGALEGEDLTIELPIAALDRGPVGAAWQGGIKGRIARIRLEHGWPVALTGEFTVSELKPPGATVALGSYLVTFDPAPANAVQLVGRVRDQVAPLAVRAQLSLKPDRSCALEGDVTPRPNAPAEVAQAVAFLGAPDAAGRRPFVLGCAF
jgi:general secretion pathway protein N